MANTKQAKKRIIQNIKKHHRNKSIISRHRTELKKLLVMLRDSNIGIESEIFTNQLKLVIKLTDSAVNKGVYHKNKVARIKSRLFSKIHAYKNAENNTVATTTQVEEKVE